MECFVYRKEGRAKQVKRLRNVHKTKEEAGVVCLIALSKQLLSGVNLLMNESSKCKAQSLGLVDCMSCPHSKVQPCLLLKAPR